MKTLREYIDQLDEISRRDALKYAGATAAGAALSKVSPAQAKRNKNFDDPQAQYLLGWVDGVSRGFNTFQPTAFPNVPWQEIKKIQNQISLLQSESDGDEINFNPTKYAHFDVLMKSRRKGYKDAQDFLNQSSSRGVKGISEESLLNRYERLKLYFDKLTQVLNTNQESLDETAEEDPIAKIDRLFRDK
jgi:hypothetical protein